MHANAQKILKKLTTRGALSLEDLADLLKVEARKLLSKKGGSRSASAAARQASSLARNHLRPLIREGYVKRVGRGQYAATSKGTQAVGARPARKQIRKRAKKQAKKQSPARAGQSVTSLRAELAALQTHLKQLATWVQKVRARIK